MKSYISLSIIINSIYFDNVMSQSLTSCTFLDSGESNLILDLRALEHITMEGSDDTKGYDYYFTPCRNAEKCVAEEGTTTAMVTQENQDETQVPPCAWVALWDQGVVQPKYTEADKTWKFQYNNGDDCYQSPREFNAYFNCDPTAGDYKVTLATEITACTYEMYIDTQWACPNMTFSGGGGGGSSSSISGGTVFIIALCVAIFLYFVVGWVVCALMNQKDRGFSDVVGNIPHLTFWSKLPALVFAGCGFTLDSILGLFNKNKEGDSIADEDYDKIAE